MAGIGGRIVTGDLAGTIVLQLGAIRNFRLPRDRAADLSHVSRLTPIVSRSEVTMPRLRVALAPNTTLIAGTSIDGRTA